jgi:GT2 family glycosyltransferase
MDISLNKKPLVGIVIASHNRKKRLRECLEAVFQNTYRDIFVCVIDDGSSDGTWEMLNTNFPQVHSIKGNGMLWWGGATNKGIESCLKFNCEYVIFLNDDCIIQAHTISKFVECSYDFPGAVIASAVLDINYPMKIWWAGSSWGAVKYIPFIWLIRQKYPHHTHISNLKNSPYNTSEFTGRAVFIPRNVFETVGVIDSNTFPQYGSDNDFSLRVTTSGIRAIVDPKNKVFLYTEEAGQNTSGNFLSLPARFFKLMFFRKHGEVAIYWWHILRKHAPFYAIVPSYLFIITLTFLRVFRILPVIYKVFNYGSRKNF